MRRPKLKCADCGQRWVPGEDIDEDEAVAAVQEEVRAARNPLPPPPSEPAADQHAEPDSDTGALDSQPTPWGKWLLAIVIGAAFATASAGLWVGRIAPEALPGIGPLLAQASPPVPLLDVAVTARISRLPGGGALLEVTGRISNPGRAAAEVPALQVRLLNEGAAVEWVIPPPAAMIAPGQQIGFASSSTDVPAGPITVQVRLARGGRQGG